MTKNFTRPGVEAAVRLSQSVDEKLWESIEAKYNDMLVDKGGSELLDLDGRCSELAKMMKSTKKITKDDLLLIVKWKFAKGKSRYALMNHLNSNKTEQVESHTNAAFDFADRLDARKAIDEIVRLSGVGPATASAVLSLYNPALFAFMDDEVIECMYEGKRGYTAAIYHKVNDKCCELSKKLGNDWNPRRVGRALWTAARIAASGGDDITAKRSAEAKAEKPSKRRKASS
jgi:hypothetical protein